MKPSAKPACKRSDPVRTIPGTWRRDRPTRLVRRIARYDGDRAPVFRSMVVRNFRLFFAGQLVSAIGNWLTTIAATLFVLHLTDSGVAIGVLTACQFGPMLVFGLWAGAVVDRLDKRKLLVTTQCIAAAQSALFAVLAFSGDPPLGAIYAVALIGGFVVAIDTTARRAFVVELVDEDLVANAVSLNSALMTSARVVGPVVAGVLITTVGYAWCFALDALSYIGPVIALLMMRASEIRRAPVIARGKGQIRDALRYVRSLPQLWLPLVMTAVISTFTFNFQVVLPLLVTRTFSSTDTVFTLLFSVLSVGSFLGALWMARHTTLRLAQTIFTAALLGVATLAMAVTPNLAGRVPDRTGDGPRDDVVHHVQHRQPPADRRRGEAGPGARVAERGAHRLDADRWAHRRRDLPGVGRPRRPAGRRGGVPAGSRVRCVVHGAPADADVDRALLIMRRSAT